MPYLDETGLAYYAPKLKEWISSQPVKTLPSSLYPWTLTEKAGAVTCWPVGGTQLKPTVDFLFTETPPVSGDKGPDNHSTITGVSAVKVTRCGKNLLQPRAGIATQTINGVTFTVNSDGSYTANGTATGNADFYLLFSSSGMPLKAELTYTLSGCPSGGSVETYQLRSYIFSFNAIDTGSGATFVSPSTGTVNCFIRINSGTTVSNLVFKPQLELGSTATAFEPYEGSDYTISLGGTFYGGTLDVASGVMTVKSQKLTIDENCIFTFFNDPVASTETRVAIIVYIPSFPTSSFVKVLRDTSSCDSFPLVKLADIEPSTECIMFGGDFQYVQYKQIRIYMLRSTLGVSSSATAAEINNAAKTWFTSHPATFIVGYDEDLWTTVTLTPTEILALTQADKYTPRLNTIYTDASAVQVGYVKSPIREEYELQQAIVAQGGNV